MANNEKYKMNRMELKGSWGTCTEFEYFIKSPQHNFFHYRIYVKFIIKIRSYYNFNTKYRIPTGLRTGEAVFVYGHWEQVSAWFVTGLEFIRVGKCHTTLIRGLFCYFTVFSNLLSSYYGNIKIIRTKLFVTNVANSLIWY